MCWGPLTLLCKVLWKVNLVQILVCPRKYHGCCLHFIFLLFQEMIECINFKNNSNQSVSYLPIVIEFDWFCFGNVLVSDWIWSEQTFWWVFSWSRRGMLIWITCYQSVIDSKPVIGCWTFFFCCYQLSVIFVYFVWSILCFVVMLCSSLCSDMRCRLFFESCMSEFGSKQLWFGCLWVLFVHVWRSACVLLYIWVKPQ